MSDTNITKLGKFIRDKLAELDKEDMQGWPYRRIKMQAYETVYKELCKYEKLEPITYVTDKY